MSGGLLLPQVTQVPLQVFLQIRTRSDLVDVEAASKAQQLQDTYACFKISGDCHQHHRHGKHAHTHGGSSNRWSRKGPAADRHKDERRLTRTEVVKIGSKELSRQNLARKDFMALMNKLSRQNKLHIHQTVQNVFREDCLSVYVDILWDLMQRSADLITLYMEVIDVLVHVSENKESWPLKWAKTWDEFEQGGGPAPNQELLADDDYGEFCDYIKWKKRTNGALCACVHLAKAGYIRSTIPMDTAELIKVAFDETILPSDLQPSGTKVSDAHIDQLRCMIAEEHGLCCDRCIRDAALAWCEGWCSKGSHLRPSTRFKMLDLMELCSKAN